ncbi:unnamed protein product [Rotaria sp. Silwood2]|nr:unnamed protein product [Rotaria sp. Silwood2]CAF2484198.1 unnamed protein product [Rotaria sp. Silwood2]CAF2716012.1 unnamed protein product [Rotaria sp. Silwood2]CAF3878614.1 unnamed protein product [Rotaria sp. Silwood2]CAF3888928.1 unnamed protein product [Rotaria sp. Silwood2]
MNSLQVSYPHDELFNIDFNERINSLHISLISQLESSPNKNLSLEQIFHLIPIIFRFFRKNLQSQEKFSNEYNNLSNTIQNTISIFTQYIHDRHNHENEIFFLKDKISQLIGQIGYTQYCLEQYWTIIYSLEHEIERLQILLSNPQVLQINLQKFQTFQESQKIQLDRFIKEKEKLKVLINKQKDAIQTIQTQIEIDLKELQTIKPLLDKIKLEQKDIYNHWLQIGLSLKKVMHLTKQKFLEKQNSYLQNIFETTQNMKHEYNDRIKTTQVQYDLVQKQFNDLRNTYYQTNQNLLLIQTNETNVQ